MNALFDPFAGGGARPGRRIAVIGAGISGLGAAWLLGSRHEVMLYERAPWLGGHANTVDVAGADGPVPVDTGFIVYNEPNYPNLTALFAHLGVATRPASMSFAASIDDGAFEYSSRNLNRLLGQRRNLLRPRFWRMVRDIVRFYAEARGLAASGGAPGCTLGEHLSRSGYAGSLRDDHLIPMCAAIWSTAPGEILDMPLHSFVRFFANHGLLNLVDRPLWRTVSGGSRAYVRKLVGSGRFRVNRSGAARILRPGLGAEVIDGAGERARFDAVVLATHADTALGLLEAPTPAERDVLGRFRYTTNRAVLHGDPGSMPRRRRVWSSWNFCGRSDRLDTAPLTVTYWMNSLQHLNLKRDLFVTLNPTRPIRPELIEAEFDYQHPAFDQRTLDAQARLWDLQGRQHTWFCGAHFGYGFHEDGLQSGLAVAELLGGVQRPWPVPAGSNRIALPRWQTELT